jgi:hypothetical protein
MPKITWTEVHGLERSILTSGYSMRESHMPPEAREKAIQEIKETIGIDGSERDKDALMANKDVRRAIRLANAKMGGEDSVAGKEFRAIIRNVNETASQMTKRWAVAYKIMLKKIRPTVPFLVAGAGIGFFTGFTHNVMKCDYNA